MRTIRYLSAFFLVVCLAVPVWAAGESGTAAEAKAMLEKAVAAIMANKQKALEEITKGEDGFREKDLYPYCGGPDGMFTAHPSLVGKSLRDLMDKSTPPKPIGQEIYKSAQEGKISEIDYMWPRPGQTEPVQKETYYTKVGDQICAVGYYK